VTSQIVLTSHLIAFDLFAVSNKTWNALSDAQKTKLETEAKKAIDWSTQKHLDEEARLVKFFKDQGLKVYTPNQNAFREYAQKMYLESEFAKDWPPGMLDKINAL
jgi:TRAP-type C4-dicarboxylate transport system substrate-binding protein